MPNGVYDVNNDGSLIKGENNYKINVSGTTPSDGWIKQKNGEVVAYSIKIGDYTVSMSNNEVTAIKNGNIADKPLFKRVSGTGNLEVGEEVYFGTEHFNIISTTENETVLLAKYNLLVGNNFDSGRTSQIPENSDGYGLQSDSINCGTSSCEAVNGFSGIPYWTNNNSISNDYAKDLNGNAASSSGNPYPYVYDSNSNLYVYVNNYKKELENIGADIKKSRLLSYEEVTDETIGCSTNGQCPNWIDNTRFWLGSQCRSVNNENWYIWTINTGNEKITCENFTGGGYFNGVRPVIVIATSDILK